MISCRCLLVLRDSRQDQTLARSDLVRRFFACQRCRAPKESILAGVSCRSPLCAQRDYPQLCALLPRSVEAGSAGQLLKVPEPRRAEGPEGAATEWSRTDPRARCPGNPATPTDALKPPLSSHPTAKKFRGSKTQPGPRYSSATTPGQGA